MVFKVKKKKIQCSLNVDEKKKNNIVFLKFIEIFLGWVGYKYY